MSAQSRSVKEVVKSEATWVMVNGWHLVGLPNCHVVQEAGKVKDLFGKYLRVELFVGCSQNANFPVSLEYFMRKISSCEVDFFL